LSDGMWREVRVVVFDVGETLVDETRHWSEWADWLGIPRFTFLATMGGVIARGEPHRHIFELLRPGLDLAAARQQRIAEGWRYAFTPADLYPDALPCIRTLRERGSRVGIAGNQPTAAIAALAARGIEADFMAMSRELGVEKPDPLFFMGFSAGRARPIRAISPMWATASTTT
jgi:FMN phosphatase YigB (HAD superfamily)